jgi:hypothetical protein
MAATQMLPQLPTALTIGGNVLIEAFVADEGSAGDLRRTSLLRRQPRFHGGPLLQQDPNLCARRVSAPCTLSLGGSRLIRAYAALMMPKLATGRRRAFRLHADLAG